ncbi:MAG TPA: sugar ABC transporter substrate-binding protein, partial [Longimicrobiales bacterium]|nr:sugar ABC transporter substrate-binding protein [Longimicrobiales bacterium]
MVSLRTARSFALVIALAACQSSERSEGVITLRFWGLGREGEVVAELIDEFERAHPNIRVESQQIPWTAAHEKLLTAHVGRATPDVAQLGNTWVPEFAAIGALEPLNARLAASNAVSADAYFAGIWATNIAADTVWGIPWYVDTRVLFYRKDLLAAAGYDSIPQSWSGWLEAMRAVKRQAGPNRYAIYLPTNEWMQPVVLGMQMGAPLLRDDGRYGGFRDARFRTAFDFYLSLYREGLAPPMGQNDIANAYQEFERGTFAMWITGPWNMGEFKRRMSASLQDRWATAPLPGPSGAANGISIAGGASLVMFRGTQHKDAAWALIEYLARPDVQERFYQLTGSLPARKEAWLPTNLANDEHARAFWVQLQRTRALPAVPEIEAIVQRVAEHAETSIRGGRPAGESLAAIDADVDRL